MNEHGMTPDPKHRHAAASEQTHTRRAARDLAQACIAVGELLGKPAGMELSRRVEDLSEHAGEHVYHLEREIERLDEVIGTLNREIVALKAGRDRAMRAYMHLDTELRIRARRARRPLPPVILEATALLSGNPDAGGGTSGGGGNQHGGQAGGAGGVGPFGSFVAGSSSGFGSNPNGPR